MPSIMYMIPLIVLVLCVIHAIIVDTMGRSDGSTYGLDIAIDGLVMLITSIIILYVLGMTRQRHVPSLRRRSEIRFLLYNTMIYLLCCSALTWDRGYATWPVWCLRLVAFLYVVSLYPWTFEEDANIAAKAA